MAAIGSAVGLGNIWRFPGVAYEEGGGAFLIPYLIALFMVGIPILFLDYAIGHRFRGAAPLALRRLKKPFETLGWFQVALLFVISVFYAAVIAWALSYFVFSFDQRWESAASNQEFFTGDYLQAADPGVSTSIVSGVAIPMLIVWFAVLITLVLGVAKGIEKVNMIFIPLLVVGFTGLVIRAVTLPGAADGLNALFTPNWSALLDPSVWIAAFGHIFFSLSIAFGIMITYASFQRRKANMTSSGLVVAFANSSFEILAGVGVFAALGFLAFQENLSSIDEIEGLTGPMLSFVTFPAVISEMPGAAFFGMLFFGSLVIAGFTSLISLLAGISTAVQEKFGLSRRTAAVAVSAVSGTVSMALFSTTTGLATLDVVDNFANNVGVVLSALIMAVLVVWVARDGELLRAHLSAVSTFQVGRWWILLVGVVGPAGLLYMLGQQVIDLIGNGYGDNPTWFVGVFGWGAIGFALVVAILFTLPSWKGRDADFVAWPPLNKDGTPVVGRNSPTMKEGPK